MPSNESDKNNQRISGKIKKSPSSDFIPGFWEEAGAPEPTELPKGFGIVAGWGRLLLWLIIFVLIGAGVWSGFLVYQYFSAQEVSLEIQMPKEIQIGVPFDLSVNYGNNSGNFLREARLSLDLPADAVIVGGSPNQSVIFRDLDDIPDGVISRENYRLMFIGGESSVKRFDASLSYQTFSLGSRFEETASAGIAVKEPGVFLDLVLPKEVLGGEQFDIHLKYRNVSPIDFPGSQLELVYPSGFEYQSASAKPTGGNNVWDLGILSPGSEGEIEIKGTVSGPNNAFFNVRAKISMTLFGQHYQVNARSGSLTIAPSPLELDILLNGRKDYIARAGDRLVYTLNYKNNSGVGLADVIVKARLISEMFNFAALPAGTDFNSITNTVTWNASTNKGLKVLPAGGSGSLTFELKVKNDFPIKRLGDRDYTLKVDAQIESPTVPYYLSASRTLGLAEMETKVTGRIDIATKVFFRDAPSGIVNKGSIPPKVNQPTQYTVHWVLTNYSTDVRNVEARASLQPGVVWTGQVISNAESQPVYNERTKEIIWLVDGIPATKGVISDPVEAIFQIEATPSILNVNDYQPLITQTSLRAFDEFVELEIESFAPAVSTQLPDDLTVGQRGGIVIQ